MNIQPYAKFAMAIVTLLVVVLIMQFVDNDRLEDFLTLAALALGAAGVYQVPNHE